MKVIAMYLPQYHRIEENDKWWGEGYTEWTAVKNAVAYSKKQNQPRVPLDNNYYDLADENATAWKWQAELAKEYHIYGFAIYHYWFGEGKCLLEKPMEILLRHPEINLRYSICWANESWRKAWYDTKNELLMEQTYGDAKEWKKHFEFLLPFFKDDRYIKIKNKPMVCIYHPAEISDLDKMLEVWNQMAMASGFDGLHIVAGNTGAALDYRKELFDAYYNFEPSYTLIHKRTGLEKYASKVRIFFRSALNKLISNKIVERPIDGRKFTKIMERNDPISDSVIYPGAFPQWDNTPRRKYAGTFFEGMDKNIFLEQIEMEKKKYVNAEYLFINAWNEWGEGAYLEPDESNRYDYLEVIRNGFEAE